jgi:glucose dehydrogenase
MRFLAIATPALPPFSKKWPGARRAPFQKLRSVSTRKVGIDLLNGAGATILATRIRDFKGRPSSRRDPRSTHESAVNGVRYARRRRARAVAQAQRGSEWRQHCCCLRRIHALRNHGLFTPPSLQGSIVVPYFGGGSNWGGMAYDPQSHLAILNAMNLAGYARLFASGDYAALKRAGGPDEVAPMIGAPFGMRPVLSYGVRPALAPHTGSAEPKR